MDLPFDVHDVSLQGSDRHNGNPSDTDASRTLKIIFAGERGRLTGGPDRRAATKPGERGRLTGGPDRRPAPNDTKTK